jgi:hypothetical protein
MGQSSLLVQDILWLNLKDTPLSVDSLLPIALPDRSRACLIPECCRSLCDGVPFLVQFESIFSVKIISMQSYLLTRWSVFLCSLVLWQVFKCPGTRSDGSIQWCALPLQACEGSGRALGRAPSTDEGASLRFSYKLLCTIRKEDYPIRQSPCLTGKPVEVS